MLDGSRIIALHLDLKGVPPTSGRLLELVALARGAGYNALVVEWEDMFPWTVDERFRNETAYTAAEVRAFHEAAARHGLEVIPLVQCLGHMETPLRLAEYAHLREVAHRSDVLNPLAEGARELVERMVDDVLALTASPRYFHLGGDEAWTFGTHPDTRAFVERHGKAALYLQHVRPLLEKLREKDIRPILWHDMMVQWEPAGLREIAEKADLCVWGYRGTHDETRSHWHTRHVERLREHGVRLWGATCYKGGDQKNGDLPDGAARQVNYRSWAQIAKRIDFAGMVATGWSRYATDRMQKCPIDAALDQLVYCARVLRTGEVRENGALEALDVLQKLGERERFEACHGAMQQLQDARNAFWPLVQILREAIATSTDDPRRRASGGLTTLLGQLQEHVRRAQQAADQSRMAFDGLIPPVWLERYLHERILPMVEEVAALAPRVQDLEPEAFSVEKPVSG